MVFIMVLGLWQGALIAQCDSMVIDNYRRHFDFTLPNHLKKGASLVFVLHGSGGNGKQLLMNTQPFVAKVANENVILVYPTGYKNYWNECRKVASSLANQLDINEQRFFNGVIHYFKSKHNINPKKVFAVGTSGGGHMCYKLAMTMPESFKAVTAIIANLPDTNNLDCADAKKPLAVMIVNGTADKTNPYEGGYMGSPTFTMGHVRSTSRSLSYWSTLAGYTGMPKKTLLPDSSPDGKTIEQYTFKTKGKPEVTLLKVIGGGHDYPKDIDVHVEAWAFFKRCLK